MRKFIIEFKKSWRKAEMPTLIGALQEYERHFFQESGDILRNASYFAIKVQNAIAQVSCKLSFNIA